MKNSLIIFTVLLTSSLFAQTDSYTVWIGDTEIFAHHETDVGDTVVIKKSMLSDKDTLFAEYHHVGSTASGSSTRLTIKNNNNHLLRGETNTHSEKAYKAWIPVHTLLKTWAQDTYQYISLSLVVHNPGESSAHGFKIGVLKLVD